MASKPVIAKIVKARGGHRIQLWRSSDIVFTSEVLKIGVERIAQFLTRLTGEIAANGITIERPKER